MRRLRLCAAALLAARSLRAAAQAPPPPPLAVNWVSASLGATATANSAGYWAGYTALPEYALSDDLTTFWSSTGGDVCCTETRPAWLAVSLGAPRAVAALRLIVEQDLTFTLALANSSAGPFAVVGRHTCSPCETNIPPSSTIASTSGSTWWYDFMSALVFTLPVPAVASHALLTVTWSALGGMGACSDMCDWCAWLQEVDTSATVTPRAQPPPRQP